MVRKKDDVDVKINDEQNIEIGPGKVNDPVDLILVVLNTNVKFNDTRYSIGEKIEVSQDDYEILLKAGVIDGDTA
jgi:hypothetical protein